MIRNQKLWGERRPIKFYIILGLIFLGFNIIHDLSSNYETFWERVLNNIWRTAYIVMMHYILFEYSWQYIKRNWKKVIVPLLIIFAHMMLYSWGLYGWRALAIEMNIYTSFMESDVKYAAVTTQMAFSMGSLVLFTILRHLDSYRKLKIATQQLTIQKQEAELNFLKAQTNPHFLFNTLNNIYSLARVKDDLAPESIMRLSKILRYMLYETSGEFIAIEQELKVIDDYIELEKLRYDETLRIYFKHDIEDMKQALPPLLLIPLVENAFKHGVSETRGKPYVDIHLAVNKRILKFIVKNSTEGIVEKEVKENIGLSNLRRQLELLYSDYSLTVVPGDSVFTATLKINLASHV